MTWAIRPIPADEAACILPLLQQVQAIHVEAHPDHYRANPDPDEVLAFLRDWLASDDTEALGAFASDGSALGYLIFEIETRKPWVLKHGQRWGMLHQIAVDQAWRRAGIGAALIDEMKARLRARSVSRIRTVYAAFNAPSAALMRKAGIEPLNIIAEGSA